MGLQGRFSWLDGFSLITTSLTIHLSYFSKRRSREIRQVPEDQKHSQRGAEAHLAHTPRPPEPSPVVDDLSLAAAMAIVVQNDVAVAPVELPIRGRVHGHLVGAFNSPDLPEQS